MISTKMNSSWSTVIQMRESNLVLCPNLIPYNNFVNIVEFVPVLIIFKLISVQRFELRASRNRNVKCFCGVETLLIKQIKVVFVN